jgi:hypothetical protein
MYKINKLRPATHAEAEAIQQHLVDYPRCDGTEIVDDHDQTLWTMRRQLRCLDCRVKFTVQE